MWDTFTLFSSSYAATLGMGLVCAYLGVFCVLRRIVFTGVALAQLAAGGVAISFFIADMGLGGVSRFAAAYGATWGSLAASLAGLLGLQARRRQGRITEDALVGLAYSAAGALAILLVWRSSRGLTELQNILAGTVLLPQQSELVSLWIGLGAVALVHAIFRRELLLVSYDPEFARAAGVPEHRYQLLFLATLAVAVALALKAGGLMLVFAFLVVPPLAGLSLGERLGEAVIYALAVAAGGSLLGFLCSIGMDWPVGPSVAISLVLLLGVSLLGGLNASLRRALRAVTLALGALAVLAGPAALIASPAPAGVPAVSGVAVDDVDVPSVAQSGKDDSSSYGADGDHEETFDEVLAEVRNGAGAARIDAVSELAAFGSDALAPLLALVLDPDPGVRDAVDAELSRLLENPAAAGDMTALLTDQSLATLDRAQAAVAATRLGDERGPLAIVELLAGASDDLPFLVQDEVVALLRAQRGGEGFGYDAFESAQVNAKALAAWRTWLQGDVADALPQVADERSIGNADRDSAPATGDIDTVRAAVMALPMDAQAMRLQRGSLPTPVRLDIARRLLDAGSPADAWDLSVALNALAAVLDPKAEDLARIIRALPHPAADGAWRTLIPRNPSVATDVVTAGLSSKEPREQRAAAMALDALPEPKLAFEDAWAKASTGSTQNQMAISLAENGAAAVFTAVRAYYDTLNFSAQAAVLRRVGRDLDAQGWPLVGGAQTASDPELRQAAREALAEFSKARAAQAEWEALQERDENRALVERLLGDLESVDTPVAVAAAQALADLHIRRAIPDIVEALNAALTRNDPVLKAALRGALRQLGQTDV